jgi:hypothetical protein
VQSTANIQPKGAQAPIAPAGLLAKTNIDEIKEMFGFLAGLYQALDQLFLNGREPVVRIRKFILPPNGMAAMSTGERVYAEGHEVLRMVTPPDPDELR